MNEHIGHIQHAGAALSTKLAYAASGGVVILGYYFQMKDIGIISGIIIGGATFLTNLYFRWRDDRRKERADKRLAEWQKLNPGIHTKSPGENID